MNNQNLYTNSDFTKTGLRFFNFVFLKKIDEKDKKEAEELFGGGINATFLDMWILGGWGLIAVVCFFFLCQKYITTNLDIRLSLDLLVSGIFGLAWVYAAQEYSRAEIEAYKQMEITNLDSKKIALFVFFSFLGIYFFGFKYANIFFGAIFTTFVFFETLLRFIRKDYLNFRKLADGTLLYLSPQNLVPKKLIFIGISSIALCIGTYGASIYLIGEWKVKKAEEQKKFQEEQRLKLSQLEDQAESNGSAFIVDVYSKVKPLEHEKAVWEALRIDGGWNLNTTVYYPWSPGYPGHGGKATRYIR